VGQEGLLPRLFGEVLIPPAVEHELLRFHPTLPGFLRCIPPTDNVRFSRLRLELDRGEAEAITLACEIKADRLLIDESVGRAVAVREGLAIIGVVGVLAASKRSGLPASIGPLLDRLETEAGFRLRASLKLEALRAVGEAEPEP